MLAVARVLKRLAWLSPARDLVTVTETQLRMDGEEVELGDTFPVARRDGGLTPVQREILRSLPIRSVEAGVIVHRHRGYCGYGAKGGSMEREDALGCCPYAAADGLEACKRLAKRGLLRRTSPGRWESA